MGEFFDWLVKEYQNNHIELHLIFEKIDYDKNFSYNIDSDVLLAESSSCLGESFGGDGTTITEHIKNGNIEIKLKFLYN